MDAPDRIRNILKERKIPFSRLEHDLGFANGFVRKMNTITSDRIAAIANYLSLSISYLTTGEDEVIPDYDPEVIQIAQTMKENGILASAMTGLKAEDMQRVADFAEALKSTYRET